MTLSKVGATIHILGVRSEIDRQINKFSRDISQTCDLEDILTEIYLRVAFLCLNINISLENDEEVKAGNEFVYQDRLSEIVRYGKEAFFNLLLTGAGSTRETASSVYGDLGEEKFFDAISSGKLSEAEQMIEEYKKIIYEEPVDVGGDASPLLKKLAIAEFSRFKYVDAMLVAIKETNRIVSKVQLAETSEFADVSIMAFTDKVGGVDRFDKVTDIHAASNIVLRGPSTKLTMSIKPRLKSKGLVSRLREKSVSVDCIKNKIKQIRRSNEGGKYDLDRIWVLTARLYVVVSILASIYIGAANLGRRDNTYEKVFDALRALSTLLVSVFGLVKLTSEDDNAIKNTLLGHRVLRKPSQITEFLGVASEGLMKSLFAATDISEAIFSQHKYCIESRKEEGPIVTESLPDGFEMSISGFSGVEGGVLNQRGQMGVISHLNNSMSHIEWGNTGGESEHGTFLLHKQYGMKCPNEKLLEKLRTGEMSLELSGEVEEHLYFKLEYLIHHQSKFCQFMKLLRSGVNKLVAREAHSAEEAEQVTKEVIIVTCSSHNKTIRCKCHEKGFRGPERKYKKNLSDGGPVISQNDNVLRVRRPLADSNHRATRNKHSYVSKASHGKNKSLKRRLVSRRKKRKNVRNSQNRQTQGRIKKFLDSDPSLKEILMEEKRCGRAGRSIEDTTIRGRKSALYTNCSLLKLGYFYRKSKRRNSRIMFGRRALKSNVWNKSFYNIRQHN